MLNIEIFGHWCVLVIHKLAFIRYLDEIESYCLEE